MSETRPFVLGRARLPEEQAKWKAEALRRLGWRSKTAAQQDMHAEMDRACRVVRQRLLKGQGEAGAERTRPLREGSGAEFRRYHDLLTAFEAARDRTPEMVQALRDAAQAYIDHYDEHSKRTQQDPKNIAKKKACEATLRDLRSFELAGQVGALGPPPWDGAQAMQAASLKMSLDLASLPPGEQRATNLGGEHVSPAFWINRKPPPGGQPHSYIFKPSCTSEQPGFPDNGEPTREAMGGRVADMLNGALGFSLPVPETQVVSLGRESLPEASLAKLQEDGKIRQADAYVGSVQQFAATDGEMRSMDGAARARIPARAAQEMAVFDTITLNTDRHAGNFLVRTDPHTNDPQLVPIDHGLSFPTRGARLQITTQIGSTHNALMQVPAHHQPFTPEMRQAIGRIDPDALAESMKRERATVEQAHPGIAGTLSDESIEMSRRSAMFLKRAADRLSPAAVQVAISRYNDVLFDPALDMRRFDTVADRIIDDMAPKQGALEEYFLMPPEMQRQMKDDLAALGWDVGRFMSGDSVLTDPAMALRLWKSRIPAPKDERDPNRRPIDLGQETPAEVNALLQDFPGTRIVENDDSSLRGAIEDWRDWQRLGGTKETLREAMGLLGIRCDNIDKAYQDVRLAARYLRQAAGLRVSLDNDATNDALADIRNTMAYLEKLLPVMAPQARTTVERVLQGLQAAMRSPNAMTEEVQSQAQTVLLRTRNQQVDAARARLLGKFDTLIRTTQDEAVRQRAEAVRPEVEAGGLVSAYAELHRLAPDLADAP